MHSTIVCKAEAWQTKSPPHERDGLSYASFEREYYSHSIVEGGFEDTS